MARQIYTVEDNSLSVAGAGSMVAGIVVISDKGRANVAVEVSSDSTFVEKYGKPNIKKSTTMYSALSYLQRVGRLLVARAIHTAPEGSIESDTNRTARYSAALIKGKVSMIPDTVPDETYQPERIVEPYLNPDGWGLTQADIDGFNFPVYASNREYKIQPTKLIEQVHNSNKLILTQFADIKAGSNLSFGESPNNDSSVYSVTEIKKETVKLPKIVTNKPVTVKAGTQLRRVIITDRETNITVLQTALVSNKVVQLSDTSSLQSGQTVSFGNQQDQYVIQSVNQDLNQITLRENLKFAVEADLILHIKDREYMLYGKNYTAMRDFSGSDEILMNDVDLISDGDTVTFFDGLTNSETEFVVSSKGIYNEEQNQVYLDKPITIDNINIEVQLMTASEFEERDVLLIYGDNQSVDFNNVTVQILPSSAYADTARIIKVYYKGEDTGEKFEVTFSEFVDGLGKQLYVEDVINGNSNYIRVKHNSNYKDKNGNPALPLINDYSVWRENPEDIFTAQGVKVLETLTFGETDIKVSSNQTLALGTRLKFGDFEQEYKVSGKSSQVVGGITEFHITIDRGIQVDTIPYEADVKVYTNTVYKKVQKMDKVYFSEKPNSTLVISGIIGKLLDAGGNLFDGGNPGSIPDIGDLILCVQKVFGKREDISVNMLLSGGVFNKNYAQALNNIAENRQDCFAFLSNDPSYVDSTDPRGKTKEFRSSINVNSWRASLFADWAWAYDPYNKKEIMIAMDGVAAALQSIAAEGGIWGLPVAGWARGRTFYITKLGYNWSETDREELLDSQVNPCKYDKTRGISIWGNKTLYGNRSFLQARNVSFILVQMQIELREYMEGQHWEFQDANSRQTMCAILLSSFQKYLTVLNDIKVIDKTTAADEDIGKMAIYVGIVPKGIVEDIFITFGVFSNAQGITME